MIQQAIALLNQVGLELTAEEIADIFWLALQMGETESISESPSIPKTPLSERPITEDSSPETPPINLNPPTATASEPYAELYPSPPPEGRMVVVSRESIANKQLQWANLA